MECMDTEQSTGETPKLTRWQRHKRSILIAVASVIFILAAIVVWFLLAETKHAGENQQPVKSTQTTTQTQPQSTAPTWKGTVNPAALTLGNGHVGSTPKSGYITSCTTTFRGGGAQHAGSWIDESKGTWNSQAKVTVGGSVNWPDASYTESTSGSSRVIKTNDLPVSDPTGIFPIRSSDAAYQFDRNPNSIMSHALNYSLPLDPTAASAPSCLGMGPIGVMTNGVLLYNALDDGGRDAVAYETQDECSGHPDGQERYHYHDVASCIMKRATGTSTLVGYAFDGYGIYVERDSKGNLPTNADLDECHGRTSDVSWNGKTISIYHYDATLEYPYTIGCYHGSSAVSSRP
jgi:hypothetical protein